MSPSRPDVIVGLRFEPGGRFEIGRIASSEALLFLLANTTHGLSSVDAVPRGLVEATRAASSYRGTRGDAREAADALLRLVDTDPAA